MWKRLVICTTMLMSLAGYGQGSLDGFAMKQIRSMTFIDRNDSQVQLESPLFRPLTIFVFVSPECPLCKNYSVVLNKILRDFSADSVSMIGIVPGKAYEVADMNRFSKDYSLSFPLFIDPEKKLSSYMRATITPEVVVIDQKGNTVYRGAIDDWVIELGKNKLQPETDYLRLALGQYIRHQPVTVKRTNPKGCFINEY
jgi:peroxiredoxin